MKPVLSICMMVKDEEINIERCLQSLQPLMQRISSELIIVDTGSTDQTVIIAKKYTDKIYYHLWNNNFSEMRNISIGYATGDWIFIIDADEKLENYDGIISLLTSSVSKKIGGMSLLVKNITDQDKSLYVAGVGTRIFRRNREFYYQGVVHNEPIFKGSVIDTGNSLLHYGYIHSDKELMERKFQRTSMLLKSELEKNPNNFYYRFQLGITYSMHGDKEISLRQFENLYFQYQYNDSVLRENIYIFGALLQSYVVNGQPGDEAVRAGLHGLRLEPEYVDLYYFLAQVYELRGQYEEAHGYFIKHIDLVNRFSELKVKSNVLINHYTLDKQADDYYSIAFMFYKHKDYEKARLHIKKALSMVGENLDLASRVQRLIFEVDLNDGKYEKTQVVYQELLNSNQQDHINKIEDYMEKEWQKMNDIARKEYCDIFQHVSGLYGFLNRVRFQGGGINKEEWIDALGNIDDDKKNELSSYYAPILIYMMEAYPLEVWRLSSYISEETLVGYMTYMDEVDKERLIDICLKFVALLPDNSANPYQMVRIQKNAAKYLLFSGKLDNEEYKEQFATYIKKGRYYLETLYSPILFELELLYDLKNREEIFLLYMILAENFVQDGNRVIQYLKKALGIFPEMSKGVEIALQRLSEKTTKNELEELIEKLLIIVEGHIVSKKFDEALKIVLECESIIGSNLKLLAKKAEIYQKKYEY